CPLLAQSRHRFAPTKVYGDLNFCHRQAAALTLLICSAPLPPAAVVMAVAPPTVTMMTMVIIPVVNHRAKIVLGSGFADWRDGSGEGA
ncbi:MAG: hypothetical protein WBA14_04615, partial [Pseudolabrys sp.]